MRNCRELCGRGGSGAATGNNAKTPDTVNPLELIGRLGGLFEKFHRIGFAGEGDLSAETDPGVGVGEKLGKFRRFALVEAFGNDPRGFFGLFGAVGALSGVEGKEAAVIVGLPSSHEIADEDATVEGILDIRRGDAPSELAGVGHFHACPFRFHGEGPDSRVCGSAAIVTDQEAAFFPLQKADAGMVGQAGRAGGQVVGRWQDVGWLVIVLRFPHFLSHPAVGWKLLESDLAVEGVHCLVLHLPSGIAALDEINDPRRVTHVRVVINAESIAKLIEGYLLGIPETCVHELEAGPVRLKAEGSSLVRVVVGFALVRGQRHAAVADGAVDPPVRAEGEAVEIVAGNGNTDAEAVLDYFPLVGLAVAVGIGEAVDVRDTRKVEGAVVVENARCRAV